MSRARFESWARTVKPIAPNCGPLSLRRVDSDERYESAETEYAYLAWQAATSYPKCFACGGKGVISVVVRGRTGWTTKTCGSCSPEASR